MSTAPSVYSRSPPATSVSSPVNSRASSHARAVWVAALVLPFVLIVSSGLILACLCWRRMRSQASAGTSWNKLGDSPAPMSSNDHRIQHGSLPPPTRPYARPLVLLARTRSTLVDPPLVQPSMSQRSSRRGEGRSLSKFSFPPVSTKLKADGSRILVKKNGKTWPPTINPLELNTIEPHRSARNRGEAGQVPASDSRVPDMPINGRRGAELQRGPSLISGYHSESKHNQRLEHLGQLVEEAKATRQSWTEGDDELDRHFSTVPTSEQAQRSRALSSRSLSEYSHHTMGATTLGRMIDQEIDAINRDFGPSSSRSNVPALPLTLTNLSTEPLSTVRATPSSADNYSLQPVSFVPFPRLEPIPRASLRPLLSSPPSTFDTVSNEGDGFALPPPLPFDRELPTPAQCFPDGVALPPSPWVGFGIQQHCHQVQEVDRQSTAARQEAGAGPREPLIEWRKSRVGERREENARARRMLGAY